MLDIKITPETTSEITEFLKEEWKQADLNHYGKVTDWKKEKLILQAFENNELVGVIELTIQVGVMHITEVIVKHKKQQKGIGKSLMKKAEELAKEKNLHKIYLETGASWEATKFYEALGYTKTGDLPKHWVKHDFVIYTKFLD